MAELTTMWKVVYGRPCPVEVTAENPCWPNRDSEGEQIFANTHFLKLEDAWTRHLQEHKAGLLLACERTENDRNALVIAERKLCDAAQVYGIALRTHERYLKTMKVEA